jgi:diguanylate cyclase (GGDEF)-like protein
MSRLGNQFSSRSANAPNLEVMKRARSLLNVGADPYAGGDLATARRLGALVWMFSTVFAAALLPLSPPDAVLGVAGWPLVAAGMLAGLAAALRLANPRATTSWEQLLRMSYLATAQLALLHWLTGGSTSAYPELYLLIAAYAGAIHPPRRVLGVVAAVAVASVLPLVYGGWDTQFAAQTLTRVLLDGAVALAACVLMSNVRVQRAALQDRGERAELLARIDALTELPNRRAFEEALAAEISRARRSGAPLCLVVADLDRFKSVNDQHGHLEGDALLRSVADALRDEMRQHDACFRWGGDEFALLLPGTTRTEADAACGRLSAAVQRRCRRPDNAPLTMACAAAQLTEGMTGEDFIRAGDAALLAVKEARRTLRAVS